MRVFSSKALALLRKKRYQEQLIEKARGQLDNLEAMVESIEFQQMENEVIEGIKAGNEALSSLQEVRRTVSECVN